MWVGHCIRRFPVALLALGLGLGLGIGEAGAAEEVWRYQVRQGDTLIALSQQFLQPSRRWQELQRLNRVANPRRLQPGSELQMPVSWLAREASFAQTLFVRGDVQLLRAGQAPQPLQVGTELRSGDLLRSGEQSSATLRFADGSRLLLSPQSELTLEQLMVMGRSGLHDTRLLLQRGGADSKVQPQGRPSYELRTPGINLGVRGTEFRVQADASGSRAAVLEGRVAAGRGGREELALNAGQGIVAKPGEKLQARPLPAAPSLSAAPALVERIPLQLAWAAAPGAKAYRAQVFADGDKEQLLLDGRFEQPQASWADLPDGRYRLRVRALDDAGLEGLSSEVAFKLKARPEPPFIRQPAPDEKIYGDSLSLAWTAPQQAQAYRLQIAATPDFATPLVDRADLKDTELKLAIAHGHYHWRLASIAAGPDQGPWGEAQQVTLKPVPPAPPSLPPDLEGKELKLRWGASSLPGARYQAQWSSDPEFKALLSEQTLDQPSLVLPRPGPGRYWLRVRTVDADGHPGPFGTPQGIEIPRPWWPWLIPAGLLLLAL
ncbi:FecR domain-containing protein [Pelomonas sp. SE-A7]|uniref:FecR domain-containing protein n=1 Tax=Pelomonas sp. SE-A7 TaxID=3054953 RepID=UPI00259D2D7C|nr:FecR domain-containing protein [Pelomonas sp. SE-A7]MDM4766528.1 FecR domain-containing protein [Pelomonas sp. SE-A7]